MVLVGHVAELARYHPIERPGQHVAGGLEFGKRRPIDRPHDKADPDDREKDRAVREQTDDEVETGLDGHAKLVGWDGAKRSHPVDPDGTGEEPDQDREDGAVDQDPADHGDVLVPGGLLDLATDLGGTLGVSDDEKDPWKHQERSREVETTARARERVAGRRRGRDDLSELQAAELADEDIPCSGDMAAARDQEDRRDQDAAARKQEGELLPAPVSLATEDEQCPERDVDERAEDEHPDRLGDRGRDVIENARAGDAADRLERDRDREGQSEPGVEPDPEEDQPDALAPGHQPAEERVESTRHKDVVAA